MNIEIITEIIKQKLLKKEFKLFIVLFYSVYG